MRLTIKNTTDWSDAALRVIVRWLLKRAGITDWYKLRMTNSRAWGGVCLGKHRCTVRLSRRFAAKWPIVHKYNSQKSFPEIVLRTRLEVLVHILAHEVYHSAQAREVGGWRAPEWDAENWSVHALTAFQKDWSELRKRIMADMRVERQRSVGEVDDRLDKRVERVRDLLEVWQRKAKLAATKIKRYKAALVRVEKKAAARHSLVNPSVTTE